MSYRGLLAHRVTIKRSETTIVDGVESFGWVTVASGVPCRMDLQFIRSGRDPQWTPEAGRMEDRTGVGFFLADAPVRTGDRVIVTRGPSGTFLLEGSIDEVQGRHGRTHHIEVGVKEVPGPVARASA